MTDYRVVADSVGGTKCLVVYRGEKPICTVWDDGLGGLANGNVKQIVELFRADPQIHEDMKNLSETITTLGGGFGALQGALTQYFTDRLKGE